MHSTGFPLLLAIIATPAIGALVVALLPARRPEIAKALGYAFTLATAGLCGYLLWHYQAGDAGFQFVEDRPWIPGLGVRFTVGVDGISLFMVAVTALLFPLGLLGSEKYIAHRVKHYVAWFLMLEMAIMGIFLTLDLVAFFIFWEFMLVPMYFLILGWGSARRKYAATKFFLYTGAGSALLLASTLVLGFLHQADTGVLSFDFRVLAEWNGLSGTAEVLLFLGFMAAFAIKAPLFPFHTWLPDVHTEAPTAGSVVLAGIIIKMGAYGFVRFSFELFPQASVDLAPLLLVLAVIGILYGAIVAAMQTDLKRVIAYSSVAHMGFVVLGIFSLTAIGIDGAVFTMVSHPLTTGALFLLVGMIYERLHTREIGEMGGLWKPAPILTGLFVAAMFAGIGLPGFSGFVGEFLSLVGAFVYDRPFAIVATFGVILAALYMLWAFQKAFTGRARGAVAKIRDVDLREIVVVVPLVALSLFLGIYPKPVLDRIEPASDRAVLNFERKTDYRSPEDADERRERIREVERAERRDADADDGEDAGSGSGGVHVHGKGGR
ncbi:MAG: NADH:ubiquinone oxidoreductase subunit M [Acidimicrobiia bacterium]